VLRIVDVGAALTCGDQNTEQKNGEQTQDPGDHARL
jgi:hypothetical protein